MTDDLVQNADGFRLGIKPSDDDVYHANWVIDRQSARIEALEAENARYRYALRAIANLEVWPDNLMSDKDIARAALAEQEKNDD